MYTTIRKWVSTLILLALLAGLGAFPSRAHADPKILYVFIAPSNLGDCSSWANRCGLQHALSLAESGDQIWVMGDNNTGFIYKPTTIDPNDRNASFVIPAGVAVYGGFYGNETLLTQRDPSTYISILSGDIGVQNVHTDNSYRIVTFASGSGSLLDGFTIRHAMGGAQGGGIFINAASPSIANVILENNTADTGGLTGRGGGMYVINGSPSLSNVQFNNNEAETFGGGLYAENSSLILSNVEFNENNALYGGGVFFSSGSPTMTDVTFNANTVSEDGGGLYAAGSGTFNLHTIECSANQAGGTGGGFFIEHVSMNIINGTFTQNSAENGGGIHNAAGTISVSNAVFSLNEATTAQGGGINNITGTYTAIAYLTNVTLSQNDAATEGGGMHNTGNAILTDVTFSDNTALTNGGGYKSGGGETAMTNVIFENNIANTSGGGMYTREATVTLTDARFTGNSAGTYGGGMMNEEAAIITLTGGLFNGNSAGNGGALYNKAAGTIQLSNVTLSANEASDGAGIYNDASSPSLFNATITANSVLFSGGGMFNTNDSDPIIKNSIIWGNLPLDAGSTDLEIHNANPGDVPLISYSIIAGSGGSTAWVSTFGTDSGGNLDAPPLLAALADNGGPSSTHALGTGSPAIDSGEPATCTATDQRGIVRAVSDGDKNGTARCDRGAFEVAILSAISSGARDGWILESTETSNTGGTLNDNATTLTLGDNAANKQYRAVLSFSTAGLPDDAVITRVTLKLKHQGIVGGGNPIDTFRGFMVDIKKGNFGNVALQLADFKAAPSQTLGAFKPTLTNGWYSIILTKGKAQINLTGNTQIRLSFKLDDNNNSAANYLRIFSGDAGAASRPQLIVEYFIP